jgi:anti-sigma factor RsiW
MTHVDDDILLKFILQTLDAREEEFIKGHLARCPACRGRRERMEEEVGRIRSVQFAVELPTPPALRSRRRHAVLLWRMAAVLAGGFLLGYATGRFSDAGRVVPVQQRFIPSGVAISGTSPSSCPAVDIALR